MIPYVPRTLGSKLPGICGACRVDPLEIRVHNTSFAVRHWTIPRLVLALTLPGLTCAAPAAENLVSNGSFEDVSGGVGGEIVGWSGLGDISWTGLGIGGSNPSPYEGERYFSPGAVAKSELQQVVDLTSYEQATDSGAQSFAFSGWLLSGDKGSDLSRVVVEYRNASGDLLSRYDSGDRACRTWTNVSDTRVVPVGTRSALVRLVSTRIEGKKNEGYFDAISLVPLSQPLQPPTKTVDPQTRRESRWKRPPDLVIGILALLSCVVGLYLLLRRKGRERRDRHGFRLSSAPVASQLHSTSASLSEPESVQAKTTVDPSSEGVVAAPAPAPAPAAPPTTLEPAVNEELALRIANEWLLSANPDRRALVEVLHKELPLARLKTQRRISESIARMDAESFIFEDALRDGEWIWLPAGQASAIAIPLHLRTTTSPFTWEILGRMIEGIPRFLDIRFDLRLDAPCRFLETTEVSRYRLAIRGRVSTQVDATDGTSPTEQLRATTAADAVMDKLNVVHAATRETALMLEQVGERIAALEKRPQPDESRTRQVSPPAAAGEKAPEIANVRRELGGLISRVEQLQRGHSRLSETVDAVMDKLNVVSGEMGDTARVVEQIRERLATVEKRRSTEEHPTGHATSLAVARDTHPAIANLSREFAALTSLVEKLERDVSRLGEMVAASERFLAEAESGPGSSRRTIDESAQQQRMGSLTGMPDEHGDEHDHSSGHTPGSATRSLQPELANPLATSRGMDTAEVSPGLSVSDIESVARLLTEAFTQCKALADTMERDGKEEPSRGSVAGSVGQPTKAMRYFEALLRFRDVAERAMGHSSNSAVVSLGHLKLVGESIAVHLDVRSRAERAGELICDVCGDSFAPEFVYQFFLVARVNGTDDALFAVPPSSLAYGSYPRAYDLLLRASPSGSRIMEITEIGQLRQTPGSKDYFVVRKLGLRYE